MLPGEEGGSQHEYAAKRRERCPLWAVGLIGAIIAIGEIVFGGYNQTLRYEGVLGSNWLCVT